MHVPGDPASLPLGSTFPVDLYPPPAVGLWYNLAGAAVNPHPPQPRPPRLGSDLMDVSLRRAGPPSYLALGTSPRGLSNGAQRHCVAHGARVSAERSRGKRPRSPRPGAQEEVLPHSLGAGVLETATQGRTGDVPCCSSFCHPVLQSSCLSLWLP